MRMLELVRSTAFRLALAFALATTVATAIVFAVVYLEISTSDVARLRLLLSDEAAKGVNESDDELRRALELRLTRDLRRLDYVALFSADGALVYGNIEKIPGIDVDGAAHFVDGVRPPGAAAGRSEPALFVARRRSDGSVLLLGRSLLEVYAIRSTVLRSLVAGLAPAIGLALAIGAFFARRATRRLATIHETIARIMQGDLKARLPSGGADDDIDKISRSVNAMLDELARLLDQLKSVGDNIAHDLRTPLAVMRAKLERGLQANEDDELRAAAAEALDQLDKALVMVAALLRVSAVESELRASAFREIDLAKICADLFEFYEPVARAKDIEMTLQTPATAPMRGDADLMREAISNLIDNAIKFTPSGGCVQLENTVVEGRPVVRVCDSGRGVAPSERERIFQRFYRSDAVLGEPGYGLGLSIAKAIAGLHGLEVLVEDNAPGARFELSAHRDVALAVDRRDV